MRIQDLIAAAAMAAVLAAQTPQKAPAKTGAFIRADQLAVFQFLADPPTAGSKQLAAEMQELHRLQDTRTPAQITAAQADDAEEDIFIFRTVLGDKFSRDTLPLTAKLSDDLHNDEGVIVNPAKTFFHRPRPYNADATLKPVCKVKTDPSDYAYPSGHSTTGYLEALALTMIAPEKRAAILERADDYAHNRLVCGVHYPSDPLASKQVALAMMGVMLMNPKFQEELAKAKTETRARLGFGF